jgi:hypothetical protein
VICRFPKFALKFFSTCTTTLRHEHGTEPGKGMRVGDVYLGVVAKVISGMQGGGCYKLNPIAL